MTLRTPLRYPGGKRKLASFVSNLISCNNLDKCVYAEPFAGGAGLAIELLKRQLVKYIYLNDIDYNIFCFWESVLKRTNELCKLIDITPITIDQWNQQKINLTSNDPLLKGFATFFLNRTNRSGIILGGVIGGKNQTGKWKIDCRYNKEDLISRIIDISKAKDFISFYNLDANDFILNKCCTFNSKSLIYLDPPYYVKGSGLYKNYYNHNDHLILAKSVKNLTTPWMVSYDNHPNIHNIYNSTDKIEYSISYSAQNHTKGSEIIFIGNCKFPNKN